MRTLFYIPGLVAVLAVIGCGGGKGGPRNTEVSGIVTDIDGNSVRNARVYISGFGETRSNSSGAYVLDNIGEGDYVVRAEITQDGVKFTGSNVARTFQNERSKSVNVTVTRPSQQMKIHGRVINRDGYSVGGARVFVASSSLDYASSTFDITDSDGKFSIDGLLGDYDYVVTASARGYNNDVDSVYGSAGSDQEFIFTLGNATDPLLPAPTNLEAYAWTSPSQLTKAAGGGSGLAWAKAKYMPKVPTAKVTRTTINGNWIETDLFWDIYPGNTAHIGYGIYRRFGNSGSFTAIDFLRDPLANLYADSDEGLQEFETWSYSISAINTNYPDTSNGESDLSNIAVAETLGDLIVNNVTYSPLTFHWSTGSGADEYVVYLFDKYPGVGVNSIWSNSGTPTSGLNLAYSGSSLVSGKKYYYLVIGTANGGNSLTVSPVMDFIAN